MGPANVAALRPASARELLRFERMATQTLTQPHGAAHRSTGAAPNRYEASDADRYDPGVEGYLRPDVRVRQDVSERLSDDDELDARCITVTVFRGEVRLEGAVADHQGKRRAAALARAVMGVRSVKNHLRSCKSRLQEWRDRLRGKAGHAHHGHAGGGTHNAPRPAPRGALR
jgi:hypothetical protein